MTRTAAEINRSVVVWQRRQAYEKRTATMLERYGVESVSTSISQATKNIPMVISPWYRDEADGCMTRTVKAAE